MKEAARYEGIDDARANPGLAEDKAKADKAKAEAEDGDDA